jgi:hypothetical protein
MHGVDLKPRKPSTHPLTYGGVKKAALRMLDSLASVDLRFPLISLL